MVDYKFANYETALVYDYFNRMEGLKLTEAISKNVGEHLNAADRVKIEVSRALERQLFSRYSTARKGIEGYLLKELLLSGLQQVHFGEIAEMLLRELHHYDEISEDDVPY